MTGPWPTDADAHHYRWRDGQVVPCSLLEWAAFMGGLGAEPLSPGAEVPTPLHVAYTRWPDDCIVSTVFLGLDHAWGEGKPYVFETMIFWVGHPLDQEQTRCATRDEALTLHRHAVRIVQRARAW